MIDPPEVLVAELSTPDWEHTWHRMAQSEPDLPLISAAFSIAGTDARVRLLRLLREWRTSECLRLAGFALQLTDEDVWKEALDVFVTIGGPEASEELEKALNLSTGVKRDWIQEALQQITVTQDGPG